MFKIEQLSRLSIGILPGVVARECGHGLAAMRTFDPHDRFTSQFRSVVGYRGRRNVACRPPCERDTGNQYYALTSLLSSFIRDSSW